MDPQVIYVLFTSEAQKNKERFNIMCSNMDKITDDSTTRDMIASLTDDPEVLVHGLRLSLRDQTAKPQKYFRISRALEQTQTSPRCSAKVTQKVQTIACNSKIAKR